MNYWVWNLAASVMSNLYDRGFRLTMVCLVAYFVLVANFLSSETPWALQALVMLGACNIYWMGMRITLCWVLLNEQNWPAAPARERIL